MREFVWAEMFALYNGHLVTFLTSRCSDPEAVAQAVWLKANESDFDRRRGKFLNWLLKIAENLAHDIRRRERRQRRLPNYDSPREDACRLEEREFLTAALEGLKDLPECEREAIRTEMEGYSAREAAKILGCSDFTVRKRRAEGLARLRAKLCA